MAETIDRLNTSLAGRYAIQRELGSGGMATVFVVVLNWFDELRRRGGLEGGD